MIFVVTSTGVLSTVFGPCYGRYLDWLNKLVLGNENKTDTWRD